MSASDTPLPPDQNTGKPQPLDVPTFSVAGFHITGNSNEILVVASEMRPAMGPAGEPGSFAHVAPIVALRLSPQSLSDLATLLSETAETYERLYGKLKTDFLAAREAKP